MKIGESLPFSNRRRSRSFSRAAFSLVEVALALGIVSFGLMSLVALLPVGLDNFREANQRSVISQVAQKIINELQQSDFQELVAMDGGDQAQYKTEPVRYFDQDGSELESATNAIYQVNIRIAPETALPDGGTASHVNDDLATITMQIACDPAGKALALSAEKLWPITPGVSISTFSTILARNK